MTHTMTDSLNFIFVDDDEINNLIGRLTVEAVLGKHIGTTCFTSPKQALEYLRALTPATLTDNTIMLLDINMPVMTGWEFLEEFDNLDAHIKDAIRIYILSSSVDQRDRERSYANKNVLDFLVKPLSKEAILHVAGQA
jgi:CheY-like chemotaxis protein